MSRRCSTCCAGGPYREGSLQFASDGAEAVQHIVLSHAVDPLATRRQRAADKLCPLSHSRTETPHHLREKGEGVARARAEEVKVTLQREPKTHAAESFGE